MAAKKPQRKGSPPRRATTRKLQSPAAEMLWPADKVERRPVASLVPSARNARLHSDAQVAEIAASIREFGWTVPVLVDENNELIAGHGRVLAAQKLGIETIPVMTAIGWSDAQKAAYRLADNKLTLNGEWDEEKLRQELASLEETDFDIGLTGFSEKEIQKLLAQELAGETDPDEIPEPGAGLVARAGDVWLLGTHRLVCGDSTKADDVAKALNGARPHLMVTDQPYGRDYDPEWRDEKAPRGSKRASGKVSNDGRNDWIAAWTLFPGDVAYVWHAALGASRVEQGLAASGFEMRAQIIWDKTKLVMGRGDYHWQHESCWYAVKKDATGHWAGDRKQTTVWPIAHQKSETGHGTQKPVECMKRPILNNSLPGEGVYEPFSGSGTTIIACEQTARVCHAIEIDPAYVDMAILRWQGFTGRAATLEADGRSFVEVMAERAPDSAIGLAVKEDAA